MQAKLPWRWEEMYSCIVVRDADGRTVCNLPARTDRAQRKANAQFIVDSANMRIAGRDANE